MIKKIKKIEKNNSVWTREEQKDFIDLLIEYGPKLYVNDFRCLISLDEKTDKDIILLKSKHIEYEYTVNYSKNISSPPPASESFQISFNFFSEIDERISAIQDQLIAQEIYQGENIDFASLHVYFKEISRKPSISDKRALTFSKFC